MGVLIEKISGQDYLTYIDENILSPLKMTKLVDHEWSVEGGQLSATLKVRRTHLSKEYVHLINKIYANGNNYLEED